MPTIQQIADKAQEIATKENLEPSTELIDRAIKELDEQTNSIFIIINSK